MSADVLEAAVMLKELRVTELRVLLSQMGQRTNGLKKELLKRANDHLLNDCSPELLGSVRELHHLRQLSRDARRINKHSPVETPKPKPPSSEPQMIDLPFYPTLETVIPPTPLGMSTCPFSKEVVQKSDFSFDLSANQQAQIQTRSGSTSVQVVLRLCHSEGIGVEDDQFPPYICVFLNSCLCPVQCTYSSNNKWTEPSRPCLPIDITPNLCLTSTNQLSVLWGNIGKSYSLAVCLVRVVSAQDLSSELCRSAVEELDVCRLRVSEQLLCGPDPEISTTRLSVSLLCPLAKTRMSVPCRARGCSHLQCFDASFYLQMNERRPRWTCPICHRCAPFDELQVDSLLLEILEKSGEDVEEVEFLSDSSWKPVSHDRSDEDKDVPVHPLKHVGNVVVDLTEFSSDDDDDDDDDDDGGVQKKDTISTDFEQLLFLLEVM